MKPFPLSLQETFNLAYNGVVNQGCASMSEHGTCMYVGPNNTRCAAGHVFAAVEPEWDLESIDVNGGNSATEILRFMEYAPKIHDHGDYDRRVVNLLQDCQRIHDRSSVESPEAFVSTYKSNMAQVAKRYSLEVPV